MGELCNLFYFFSSIRSRYQVIQKHKHWVIINQTIVIFYPTPSAITLLPPFLHFEKKPKNTHPNLNNSFSVSLKCLLSLCSCLKYFLELPPLIPPFFQWSKTETLEQWAMQHHAWVWFPHIHVVYSIKIQLLVTIFMDFCRFHWHSQMSFLMVVFSLLS